MPKQPQFDGQFGAPGRFVMLCEGDVAGYDVAILRKWRDERQPTVETVDIRACGTGESLKGVADALGRVTRVIVVEDRDFRAVARAKEESEAKCAEREERDVAMRGWVAWSRNEIENFFLDDEVLFPAMREVFECTDVDTKAARDEAIEALRGFQVVQAAVSEADTGWAKLETARRVGGGRPKWTETGLNVPLVETVRTNLQTHVKTWQDKVYKDAAFKEPLLGKSLLDTFEARLTAWSVDPLPVAVWKRDWAGKEVLKLVRQKLASKFRAPIESKRTRIDKVDWFNVGKELAEANAAKKAKVQEQMRGALDRDIERAIQPVLVKHLWAYLTADANADMNADFAEIAKCFVV